MKHISYTTSAIVGLMVIWVVGAGAYWLWTVMPFLYVFMGFVLLLCTTGFIVTMFVSKGRAMLHLDKWGTGRKLPAKKS